MKDLSLDECQDVRGLDKITGIIRGLDKMIWGLDKSVQPPDILRSNYVQPPENFQFDLHLCPDMHLCL